MSKYEKLYPNTFTYFTQLLKTGHLLQDLEKNSKERIIILRKFFAEASDIFLNRSLPFATSKDFFISLMVSPKDSIEDVDWHFFDQLSDEIYNVWYAAKNDFEEKQELLKDISPIDYGDKEYGTL